MARWKGYRRASLFHPPCLRGSSGNDWSNSSSPSRSIDLWRERDYEGSSLPPERSNPDGSKEKSPRQQPQSRIKPQPSTARYSYLFALSFPRSSIGFRILRTIGFAVGFSHALWRFQNAAMKGYQSESAHWITCTARSTRSEE